MVGDLIEKREALVPEFDFMSGTRKGEMRRIELKKDDVISVEKTEIENSKIIYRIITSDKTVTGKLISTENDENILYFDIDGEKPRRCSL